MGQNQPACQPYWPIAFRPRDGIILIICYKVLLYSCCLWSECEIENMHSCTRVYKKSLVCETYIHAFVEYFSSFIILWLHLLAVTTPWGDLNIEPEQQQISDRKTLYFCNNAQKWFWKMKQHIWHINIVIWAEILPRLLNLIILLFGIKHWFCLVL